MAVYTAISRSLNRGRRSGIGRNSARIKLYRY